MTFFHIKEPKTCKNQPYSRRTSKKKPMKMKNVILFSLLAIASALPQYGQVSIVKSDYQEYRPKEVDIKEYQPVIKAYQPFGQRNEEFEFAKILRDERHRGDDGSYSIDFVSDDGISRHESGRRLEHVKYNPVASQGSVQFTFPNGQEFSLKYIADENGFQPQSSWLPVAPAFPHPIPQFVLDQIVKAAREDAEAAAQELARKQQIYVRESSQKAEEKLYEKGIPNYFEAPKEELSYQADPLQYQEAPGQ